MLAAPGRCPASWKSLHILHLWILKKGKSWLRAGLLMNQVSKKTMVWSDDCAETFVHNFWTVHWQWQKMWIQTLRFAIEPCIKTSLEKYLFSYALRTRHLVEHNLNAPLEITVVSSKDLNYLYCFIIFPFSLCIFLKSRHGRRAIFADPVPYRRTVRWDDPLVTRLRKIQAYGVMPLFVVIVC